MPLIKLKKLHPDPRNANVCEPEVLQKIQEHIERTGVYPPLIVRPHPSRSGDYMLIDGHHRMIILRQLGKKEADCVVWDLPEVEIPLALLTLNRLRGTDIPRKRAELIDVLTQTLSIPDLSRLLPESNAEIEGLLALLKADTEGLEKALREQMQAEQKALPVPFGFMIPADEASLIQETLTLYRSEGKKDQGQALVAICRDVLALHEVKGERGEQ